MQKNRVRTLLMASMTIMLCVAMIVGGTYALWSKTVNVENHLVAGELKLKLERTGLNKTILGSDGYMITKSYTEEEAYADFTEDNSTANVFGIVDGELVVPTSAYEATMRLTNNGDVAFKYDVIIKLTSVSNELAKQLMVSIDGVEQGYLSTFEGEDGKVVIATRNVAKGVSDTEFTVKIEFRNDADAEGLVNNDAMSQEAEFDLIVKAVQLTTDPNA